MCGREAQLEWWKTNCSMARRYVVVSVLLFFLFDAVRGVPTRLVPGPDRGRLEVYYGGTWGTVCDDSFGYADARVVCRSLGKTSYNAEVISSAGLGRGSSSTNIALDNLACNGNEYNLDRCGHNGWNTHNCGHYEDVGVICHSAHPIRLVPGPTQGRIEVYRTGKWGTVCDDGFDQSDGKVVCRYLGLGSYAHVVGSAGFGKGSDPIWLDDLTCSGSETNLDQCGHRGWGSHNCGHSEDVGVICHTGVPTRLVPGPQAGRVEVYRGSAWGTVCDDSFDTRDASVVCRSLGFSSLNASVVANSVYGAGSGTILLDNLSCSGGESNLNYCVHAGWGEENCGHGEDVGVSCHAAFPTRLVPGPSKGRVEVYNRGIWGTVCNDDFTYVDAKVVCRSLGLDVDYATVAETGQFGVGSGVTWLDDVNCNGNEPHLQNCSHRGLGIENCGHSEDVGVLCLTSPPFRLVPGPTQGRVEVYRRGIWGTVCADSFTYVDAQVVCRSLGLTADYAAVAEFGEGSGTIWLDDVGCAGQESSLDRCSHRGWGVENCNHSQDVGVICHIAPLIRLAPGPNQGRVEVYRRGIWGTVCGDSFTHVDAQVVCRSLGLTVDYATVAEFDGGSGTIWLDDVGCSGQEPSLDQCSHRGWGVENCNHSQDVGVICHSGAPTRLVPGPNHGRVEVYRQGVWGTVCERRFQYEDAKVVCGFLHQPTDYALIGTRGQFGPGSGTIWLDDVGCSGSETSLSHCPHAGWGVVTCNHTYDVGVICNTFAPSRLIPGPNQGRVEVYRRGVWGAVCDRGFDYKEAQLICSSLGLPKDYINVVPKAGFSQGTNMIWLTDVSCNGKETSLSDCQHQDWGVTNCSHSDDVGVMCHSVSVHVEHLVLYEDVIVNTTCNVSSTMPPPYTFNWTLEGIQIGNTLHLVTSFSKYDNGKKLACRVYKKGNSFGFNESAVFVYYPPPEVFFGSKHVFELEDVTIPLAARCNPPPFAYQVIQKHSTSGLQNNSSPPALTNISSFTSGTYVVKLWNRMNVTHGVQREGHGIQIVDIQLLYSPKVSCRREYNVTLHSSFKLVCSVKSHPTADGVRWHYHPSNQTFPSTGQVIQERNIMSEEIDIVYNMDNVQVEDSGEYRCAVTNTMKSSSGSVQTGTGSCTMIVTVLYPPAIETSGTLTIIEGNDVTLILHSSSNPAPHLYRWKKSDSGEDYQTSTTVPVLRNLTRSAAGYYTVKISNFLNTTEGSPSEGHGLQFIKLNVVYPPRIVCEANHVIIRDTSVNLTCDVSASPTATVAWTKESSKTSLKTASSHLSIINARVSDGGVYVCTANNTMSDSDERWETGTASCRISLSVIYPPPELVSTSLTVFENGSVTLSLPVSPNPPPHRYEWKKDEAGTEFKISDRPPVLHNIQRTEAGDYIIRVTNWLNATQRNPRQGLGVQMVKLRVLYSPKVSCRREYNVTLHSSFKLVCSVKSHPTADGVRWHYHPSNQTFPSTGQVIQERNIMSEEIDIVYNMDNVQVEDSGEYRCAVTNTMKSSSGSVQTGTGSCTMIVTVLYPPAIETSGTLTIIEGNDVTLILHSSSNPAPHLYRWKKSDSGEDYQTSTTVPVLRNLTRSAAGYYTVKISNFLNTTEGSPSEGHGLQFIKLNVVYSPRIVCEANHVIIRDTSVNLTCDVSASPTATVTWTKESSKTSLKTASSHLSIINARVSDGGVYVCTANNTMSDSDERWETGTASCRISLSVIYPPPELVSTSLTVFENGSVTLSLPVLPNPPPHRYEWKKDEAGTEFKISDRPPVLHNIQRTEAGDYIIRVTNWLNATQRNPRQGLGVQMVKLRVLYSPKVSCRREYNVTLHSSFKLVCSVKSHPTADGVRWHYHPSNQTFPSTGQVIQERNIMSEEIDIVYNMDNVQVEDSGEYRCAVTNTMKSSSGSVQTGTGSCTMTVTVLYPPAIETSGTLTIIEGNDVTLILHSSSNPAPHLYRWKKSDSGEDYQTSTTVPVLRNLTRSAAGYYTVKISNFLNTTEGSPSEGHGLQFIKLNVVYSPRIVCEANHVIIRDSSVNLTCDVSAFPTATVTWTKESSKTSLKTASSHLPIINARVSDGGVYVCTANNTISDSDERWETGTASCRISLSVIYPPPELVSTSLTVFENGNVTLSLPVSPNPPPHRYEWKKDEAGTEFKISDRPPVLHNIQRTEAGDYIIRVTNWLNATQRNPRQGFGVQMVKLRVLYSPKVSCRREYNVTLHSSFKLVCSVKSHPTADGVRWHYHPSNQTFPSTGQVIQERNIMSEEIDIVYNMDNVQVEDSGEYRCAVTNTMKSSSGSVQTGTGSCTMTVTVLYPPAIETSGTLTIIEGNDVTLILHSSSNPAPHLYRWKKSDSGEDYQTSTTVPVLRNLTRSAAGYYTVKISNFLNTTEGSPSEGHGLQFIKLNVVYPPRIVCEANHVIIRDTSVNLTCDVSAFPTATVTWTKESSKTSLKTASSHLPIINARVSDGGVYVCTANNTISDSDERWETGTASCRISLSVIYPPPELVSTSLTVFENGNVTLSLPVSPNPPPHRYEWKKDEAGTEFKISDRPPVLHNIQRTEAGDYIIRVTNWLNATQRNPRQGLGVQMVKLRVLYSPKVSCRREYNVTLHSSFKLVCSVKSHPTADGVRWHYHPSNQTFPSTGQVIQERNIMSEEIDIVYNMDNVQVEDSGEYRCAVTNTMKSSSGSVQTGTGSCTMTVTVLYPPAIETSGTLTIIEGNDVTLILHSSSNPAPHLYRWKKSDSGEDYQTSTTVPVLRNLTRSAAGYYTVKISNFLNTTEGSPSEGHGLQFIKLNVVYPPRIVCEANHVIIRDTSVNLTCDVSAFPTATVTWTKESSKTSLKTASSHLPIINARVSDGGVYVCTANNTISDSDERWETGTASCRISLSVIYPPPELVSTSLTVFENGNVTLSLPVSPNPPPHRYEWKKDEAGTEFKISDRPPVLHNIQRTEAGDYIIRVTNWLNATQRNPRQGLGVQMVKLRVLYSPKVSCRREYNVTLHSSFKLVCSVKSHPTADGVRWHYHPSNQTFPSTGQVIQERNIMSEESDIVYNMDNVQVEDSGEYRCAVTNTMKCSSGSVQTGTGSCTMTVTVLYPPAIETSGTLTIIEGNDVTLILHSSSNPAPHLYRWKKSDSGEDYQTSTTVPVLRNLTRSAAGYYTVKISNFLNTTEGSPSEGHGLQFIKLNVVYPPRIVCEANHVIIRDTSVNLTCDVSAFPTATVTWTKESSKTSLKTASSHLPIINARVSDGGVYVCTANNTISDSDERWETGTASCRISLSVIYPPPELVSTSLTVFENGNVTLSLPVLSNPPPHRYEWKKDEAGTEFKISDRPPVLHNIQRIEAGDYIIRVTNWLNATQRNPRQGLGVQMVKLRVLYPVNLSCERDYVVRENTSVNLTCTVSGSPLPNHVTWSHLESITVNETSHLVIKNVQVSNGGIYICTANTTMTDFRGFTRWSNSSCSINLTVVYPPEPFQTDTISAFESSNITLSLPVSANPLPHKYEWRKDDVDTEFMASDRVPILRNIQRADAGDYIVRVANRMNLTQENPRDGIGIQMIKLQVLYPPEVHCQGQHVVLQSSSFNLTCSVRAFPRPSVVTWEWNKSNTTLKEGDDLNLTIHNIQVNNSGTYTCRTFNIMDNLHGVVETGSESCSMVVSVVYPPPAVQTDVIYVHEGSSVNVSLPPQSDPLPHVYRWRKEGSGGGFTVSYNQPVIHNINRSDAGNYIIRVTNRMNVTNGEPRDGHGLQTVKINVLYPPNVRCRKDVYALLNSSVDLVTTITSCPKVQQVTWTKRTFPRQPNNSLDSNHKIKTESTLKPKMRSEDGSHKKIESDISEELKNEMLTLVVERHQLDNTVAEKLNEMEDIDTTSGAGAVFSGDDNDTTVFHGREHIGSGDVEFRNIRINETGDPQKGVLNGKEDESSGDDADSSFHSEGLNIEHIQVGKQTLSNGLIQDKHMDGSGSGFLEDLEVRKSEVDTDRNNMTFATKTNPKFTTMNSSCGSEDTAKHIQHEQYHIQNVHMSDEGVYQCTATNVMRDHTGEEQSGTGICAINLHVFYPPPPMLSASKAVFEGTAMTVSLPTSSHPLPYQYRWRKEGAGPEFTTGSNPPVIKNVNRTHAGNYIIEVTNLMNITETGPVEGRGVQHVTVTVLYPPEVTCKDKYTSVVNSTLTLTCNIKAVPSPHSIIWTRGAEIVEQEHNSLTLSKISPSGSGEYICTASNTMTDSEGISKHGESSCKMNVVVLSPPVPLRTGVLRVFEGDDLRLSLEDPCVPPPYHYAWRKVVPHTSGLLHSIEPPVISQIEGSAAGDYIVEVKNRMNVTDAIVEGHGVQVITVEVLYPPTIYCPEESFIESDTTANLTCEIRHGIGIYTIKWSSGFQELGNRSSLIIESATVSDSNVYICTVTSTMTDSKGLTRTLTGKCQTEVTVLLMSAKLSTSPFGQVPRHLLPYIIYIGGGVLVVIVIALLVTSIILALQFRGSLCGTSAKTKMNSERTSSILRFPEAAKDTPIPLEDMNWSESL